VLNNHTLSHDSILPQNSAEVKPDPMLVLRHSGFGGSDAQHYMDVEPWGCLRKAAYLRLSVPPDIPSLLLGSKHTDEGHALEGLICQEWCRRHGRVVTPGVFVRREDKPHLFVNLDGRIEESLDDDGPGILEIKSLAPFAWGAFRKSGLYHGYYLQMQHAMMVTGYTWGWFAVHERLAPEPGETVTASLSVPMEDQTIETWRVERDDVLIAELEEAADRAWETIRRGELPPRRSEWGKCCGSCAWAISCWAPDTPPESREYVARLVDLYGQQREISDRVNALRKHVKALLGPERLSILRHPALGRNNQTTQGEQLDSSTESF